MGELSIHQTYIETFRIFLVTGVEAIKNLSTMAEFGDRQINPYVVLEYLAGKVDDRFREPLRGDLRLEYQLSLGDGK